MRSACVRGRVLLHALNAAPCLFRSVIAQWLQKVDPKTDGAARDWVAIYDECKVRRARWLAPRCCVC